MSSDRPAFSIDAYPMRHLCHGNICYDVQEIDDCFVVWNAELNKAKLFRPLRGTNKVVCWSHQTRNVSRRCPGGLIPLKPSDQELAEAVSRHRDCGLRDSYVGNLLVGKYRFRDVAEAVKSMHKKIKN